MDSTSLNLINANWAIVPERLDGIQKTLANNAMSNVPLNQEATTSYRIEKGVAIIPITGVLTKRPTLLQAFFGGTSMEAVGNQLRAAVSNPLVSSIVLDVDSPGGTVDGTGDLADIVAEIRKSHPVVAFVDGIIASAAYWIGSQADWVICPNTGEVGSIGVVQSHHDYSGADEKAGVKRSFIYAGKYKTAGSNAAPLSRDDAAYLQAGVDYIYSMFVDAVSKNRNLSVAQIIATQGKIFIGEQAKDTGLVDQIGNIDQAINKARTLVKDKAQGITITRAATGPQSFVKAYTAIQKKDKCTLEAAMRKAVIEYPALHESYIGRR
jgi:capsid assembly protease